MEHILSKREFIVVCGKEDIQGSVDVARMDSLSDVRQLILDEFDDDMLPSSSSGDRDDCDWAFRVNGVHVSAKQEPRKTAWDILDRGSEVKLVRVERRRKHNHTAVLLAAVTPPIGLKRSREDENGRAACDMSVDGSSNTSATSSSVQMVLKAVKLEVESEQEEQVVYRTIPAVPIKSEYESNNDHEREETNLCDNNNLPDVLLEAVPYPGYICSRYAYYTTLNKETYGSVAAKLGIDRWRDLAEVDLNVSRYGVPKRGKIFKKNTLLRIPTTKCSKWKLEKLLNQRWVTDEKLAVCGKCHKEELSLYDDPEPMLVCDGCDATCHLSCAGLTSIPQGDWLCSNCQAILKARKDYYDLNTRNNHQTTLQATLPPLPELSYMIQIMAVQAKMRLQSYLAKRNKRTIQPPLQQLPLARTSKKHHEKNRPTPPSLLGLLQLHDELDVQVLNMLLKPTELILAIPMTTTPHRISTNNKKELDDDDGSEADALPSLVVGDEYAIFGCAALFQAERDDCLPMDLSGHESIRVAQKRLVFMLLRTDQSKSLQVTSPSVPSSVHLRGDENLQQVTQCFNLSELVQDCNCPLNNMPQAPTPQRLADHGLVLREYQKSSLQWMIDKERNPTGMGFAGELWSRMQFLDGSGEFFFCEMTGSLLRNIFDFQADVEQPRASKHFGSLPTAGILGEEMGLGKTVISLALICANPPPLHNQVLPREHIAKTKIEHPLYSTPPSVVGCTSFTSKNILLSNGTVVITPMTLLSQWQTEFQRFAPWMSTLSLHNDENPTKEEIASKDVVLVSTFLLQRHTLLLRKLKQIHFHRVMLDESHYNQSGIITKQSLASLSASHRFCVTGTPIGHSLADLQGQLRFLRVPQFCRSDFWKQNIGTPYNERSYDALQVLRSLLSHVVVRHSKEQTLENGEAMLSLPPRTMETILLSFESPTEENFYKEMENRNSKRFMELRSISRKTVLSHFIELNSMIYTARRTCGHPSLVNLEKIHDFDERVAHDKLHKDGLYERPKTIAQAGILEQALENALPSAKNRMREVILTYHEDEFNLMECPVCLEPTGECDIALTPCAHKFCAECIVNVLDGASSSREAKGRCPECREVIRRSELTFLADATGAGEKKIAAMKLEEDRKPPAASLVTANVNGFQFNSKDVLSATISSTTPRINYKYLTEKEKRKQRAYCHTLTGTLFGNHAAASSYLGTKISHLLQEIKEMMNKDPKSKCVVFSQFLGALNIISEECKARGIHVVRIDGAMKQHKRADALLEFSSNPDTKVFLLSMRAGAAGLNLMAADHCFILDPPQNTAIEEQAINRIHRIGQTRPVIVKRFIMKDTVEQRILSNRRSLATDRLSLSTAIDGVGIMTDESALQWAKRRHLHGANAFNNEGEVVNANSSQRLNLLEALFDCSTMTRVCKIYCKI